MPEGPEIRLAADKVARVLVGDDIIEVGFGLARLSRFEKSLSGSTVTAVDTRGKAMLTRFDNGLTLYSHNQLYGKWFTMPTTSCTASGLRCADRACQRPRGSYALPCIQKRTARFFTARRISRF
jgi:formamidopyrimidine-DNA glycosylase